MQFNPSEIPAERMTAVPAQAGIVAKNDTTTPDSATRKLKAMSASATRHALLDGRTENTAEHKSVSARVVQKAMIMPGSYHALRIRIEITC
jgi:hypothetical protein